MLFLCSVGSWHERIGKSLMPLYFLEQLLWTACGYAVESMRLVHFEMRGAVSVQYIAFVAVLQFVFKQWYLYWSY